MLPATRPLDQPFELARKPAHHHQRVAQIHGVVSAEAELAAGLQLVSDQPHRAVVHHPPLGVLGLGPGVGMEQIEHRQRPIGHAAQHLQRIAEVDADIAQRAIAHMRERLCYSIDEGFGADEAVIGQQIGTVRQMLAATEADLEVKRARIAEQAGRIDWPIAGDRDPGQQGVDQHLLSRPQGPALAASVKPIERGGIAVFVRGHGTPLTAGRSGYKRRKALPPTGKGWVGVTRSASAAKH